MSLEWTPEAIKAEIDYRHGTMVADAEHVREVRRTTPRKPSWWARWGNRDALRIPEQRKVQGNPA